MKSAGLLFTTLAFTAALLWANPFEAANTLLDRAFHAAPKWTQVSSYVRDANTQELTHGEHPLAGLAPVSAYWREKPDAPKVVLIGNSQMFSMSLAPDEAASTSAERTYPDLVAEHFASQGVLCYRLAAPGLSYSEALWYLDYLLTVPGMKPKAVVLQVNYQAFWNGGIRDSLLELLASPEFRARVERRAQSGDAYASNFADALKLDAEHRARAAAAATKQTGKGGFGAGVEEETRAQLEHLALYNKRPVEKGSFDEMLYRARLYFLRIKPSTARSISGPRLIRSQAALDAIAATCRDAGVQLVLFTAPTNPRVSLYASPDDRATFTNFVQGLAAKYQLKLFDFESTVSAELWGRQYNSPDPLHMGRRAHQVVADEVISAVNAALNSAVGTH